MLCSEGFSPRTYLVSMKELVKAGGTLTGAVRVLVALSSGRKELHAVKYTSMCRLHSPAVREAHNGTYVSGGEREHK